MYFPVILRFSFFLSLLSRSVFCPWVRPSVSFHTLNRMLAAFKLVIAVVIVLDSVLLSFLFFLFFFFEKDVSRAAFNSYSPA